MELTTEDLELLQSAFWKECKYEPTWAQKPAHDSSARIKLGVGGVRAGKSAWESMELSKYVFTPDALIWIIGPDYDQAAAEFDYILRGLKSLGMVKRSSQPLSGSHFLETEWNAKVETLSTKQGLEHIASFAPTALGITEAGQQPWEVVEKAYERTLETGGAIVISGTLEKNKYPWLSQKQREWEHKSDFNARSFSFPSWSNTKIFPGGRQDPKILEYESAMSKAKFLERCAAVALKPEGLVHPEFSYPIHVKEGLNIHSDAPVGLAIDPGYAGAYAVVFMQKLGSIYHCLSEVYMRRTKARNVIDEVKQHELWPLVSYAVMDTAGSQHHATDSQIEIWEERCPNLDIIHNKVGITDGIEILAQRLEVDEVLERPHIFFSDDFSGEVDIDGRSMGTFAEFDLYKWPPGGRAKLPIDDNNHAIKAITYFIYHHDGLSAALSHKAFPKAIRRRNWH